MSARRDGVPSGQPEYVQVDVSDPPTSSPTSSPSPTLESESPATPDTQPSNSEDEASELIPIAAGVTAISLVALIGLALALYLRRIRSNRPPTQHY